MNKTHKKTNARFYYFNWYKILFPTQIKPHESARLFIILHIQIIGQLRKTVLNFRNVWYRIPNLTYLFFSTMYSDPNNIAVLPRHFLFVGEGCCLKCAWHQVSLMDGLYTQYHTVGALFSSVEFRLAKSNLIDADINNCFYLKKCYYYQLIYITLLMYRQRNFNYKLIFILMSDNYS